MPVYRIKKEPLCFYVDYFISVDGNVFIIQEMEDGSRRSKKVCRTSKVQADKFYENKKTITIEI